ncbi:hypothetical protein [Streptomyces sp. NPDC086147]|uniref:hypothetical protein n=1 Tax=unclassified Streptomyces TaxID=2593676 RepID=UPI00344F3FB1
MSMISVGVEPDRTAGSIAAARDSARRFLRNLRLLPASGIAENVLLVGLDSENRHPRHQPAHPRPRRRDDSAPTGHRLVHRPAPGHCGCRIGFLHVLLAFQR